MNSTQTGMSVPFRQCLVMSVFGESHQLPAALFSSEVVSKVVVGVTGEYPEKILYSPATDVLLVYGLEIDINRVKVQLECLASWMGKPLHLQCVRPSSKELRKFGVVGTVQSSITSSRDILVPKGCPVLKSLWGHWHSASKRPSTGCSRRDPG